MKTIRKIVSILTLAALLCVCLGGCADKTATNSSVTTGQSATSTTTQISSTSSTTTQSMPKDPITLSTTGGAVIVGVINYDDNGWFLTPEQPLDVEYNYFLDNPSRFDRLTRIELFDPTVDGIEKMMYVGETVTVKGTFSFYRDDFEKLYMLPYVIQIGKTVEASYAAPDLEAPDLTQSCYDPSVPLPKSMDPIVQDGKYVYNPFMLSLESLELMGNDFATFYCDFVDAFLNYRKECPCPDKEFAEMLSTIIYYEFPMYDVCAESFEYVKHYDAQKKTVTIAYQYDQATHQQKIDAFMESANAFLSTTAPNQTQVELAKNIYHQLCTRVTYDYSALTEIERKNAYYAYMEGSGVCVTFTNVYNQLLTRVGIQTTTAQCDYSLTMGHVWSVITLDGKKYFCDPTFELNVLDGTTYRYFGQTFAQRLEDGMGVKGITAGRYYPYPIDETFLSDTPC